MQWTNKRNIMNKSGILPPKYFMASILLIPVFHFIIPLFTFIDFPVNLSGLVFLLIGGILNLLADKDFKKYKTTVKPFEDSDALITKGVFRITRNPMYLGMVLFLLGETILFGSASSLLIVIAFALIMHFVFILNEEKMLTKNFGEEFSEYSNTVRRWI